MVTQSLLRMWFGGHWTPRGLVCPRPQTAMRFAERLRGHHMKAGVTTLCGRGAFWKLPRSRSMWTKGRGWVHDREFGGPGRMQPPKGVPLSPPPGSVDARQGLPSACRPSFFKPQTRWTQTIPEVTAGGNATRGRGRARVNGEVPGLHALGLQDSGQCGIVELGRPSHRVRVGLEAGKALN